MGKILKENNYSYLPWDNMMGVSFKDNNVFMGEIKSNEINFIDIKVTFFS